MRRGFLSLIGVLAVAAIMIGVNTLAAGRLAGWRLDLTAQHLYTLSPGTRSVVGSLKEPVTLRLYYSPSLGARLPEYGAYADRVGEMLREYAELSHGKIHLRFLDPEPYSRTEDQAIAYGLQGVPLDQSGDQVYFGLAGTNLLDDERAIAFFQPDREAFLEYDITRLIYELSNPARPVVGVMSSLPLQGNPQLMMQSGNAGGIGGPGAPDVAMLQLQQADTLKTIPTTAQVIPPDVKVLIVAQAQNLSQATLYAIDQFVMRGGRLLALVDPLSEVEAGTPTPGGAPPADTSSNLAPLFKAWGIGFDNNGVVGDLKGAWLVRPSASPTAQPVPYLPWFTIRDGINRDDPATADLGSVSVASAGSLVRLPNAAIRFTPLLQSSDESGVVPLADVQGTPNPGRILAGFKPSGGPRVIAARVRGELHSAFSGPPPLAPGQKRPAGFPPYIARTVKTANLVVIADSDILADRFWVRTQDFFGQRQAVPFHDNGAFIANLVGSLAGGDALLGLRGRGTLARPFVRIENMRRQADARFHRTEEALQTHLTEVQKQLVALRTGRTEGGAAADPVITPEQRQAITALRRDIVSTRDKLRRVQRDLRRDISHLETTIRLLDIAAVPALLALLAIGIGLARRRRRARARG